MKTSIGSLIKCYFAFQGGQIVPPLGFQQNSSRWKTYFEKKVQNGPFAAESCFKPVRKRKQQ
jgi:hypothetical protein